MELNTLYQYSFKKGAVVYDLEYFLTTDEITTQSCGEGNLWLVVSIEGADKHRFCLSKSSRIAKQPKEIIEIIIRRETLAYLHDCATKEFPLSNR
jgi:hypothetical protein